MSTRNPKNTEIGSPISEICVGDRWHVEIDGKIHLYYVDVISINKLVVGLIGIDDKTNEPLKTTNVVYATDKIRFLVCNRINELPGEVRIIKK